MLLPSDDKIAPLVSEGRIGAGESLRGFKTIEEDLPVETLKSSGKDSPSVEIDRNVGGPETEKELIFEFLPTGPEG